MSWWSRLRNVVRPGRLQRDLDAEMQFHLDGRIHELMRAGSSREDASRQAAARFGDSVRFREASLDIKLLPWLDSIVRDARLGTRVLRRHGVVTTAAVVSLSLALGGCVAAFALIDALILRPLPLPHPSRLIYLTFPTYTTERPEADTFNDPTFTALRDAARGRVDLLAISTQVMRPVTFSGGERERVRTQYVSDDAFDVLGVGSAIGRVFGRQDGGPPGSHPVAVLSHSFWMRRFGGDPGIVGSWMALEERPLEFRQFQIVGVGARRFAGVEPGRPTDVWFPYAMYNPRAFGNVDFNWFRILGRLRNGERVEHAQSTLSAAFANVRRERATFPPQSSPEAVARFLSTPLYVRSAANGPSPLRRQFEQPLVILATIAALVLLIAGSNVGNLFLARASTRERELSLRVSIGAGRARLVQQLLVESAIVAGAANILGLFVAAIVAPAVVGLLTSPGDPIVLELRPSWPLLAVLAGLTLVITMILGLAPAIRASHTAPMTALAVGGDRAGRRTRAMRPFVAVQVAFSLIVLFVGSLLVASFVRLSNVNPGFATSDVLLVSMEPTRRAEPAERRVTLMQVLERIRRVPGVEAAGAAEFNLLGRAWTYDVRVSGTDHATIETTIEPVTPGFLEAMRVPLVAGRTFVDRDMTRDQATPVIVNETFAAQYFGRAPAVGQLLDARFAEETTTQHEVVGVVADARYDLRKPAAPTIYMPLRTNGTLCVRVAGDPVVVGSRLREEVRAAGPLFRATTITSQAAAVDQTLIRERLLAALSGFFAALGLVLAAVGLYGVTSFSVAQRTREIGIRMALGGNRRGVIRAVVTDVTRATLVGVACGLGGGLYLSRFVQTLLFETRPADLSSVALPLVILLGAAATAAAFPALRATRIDPSIALRYE